MNIQENFQTVLGVTSMLLLGACASGPAPTNLTGDALPQSSDATTQYGVVQSIELVQQPAATGGIGAGTVAGGILDNQMGDGSGNTAAAVLGAVGGPHAGHTLENQQAAQSTSIYKFTVRMSDGNNQVIPQSTKADIRVGDRVLIDNGVLRRY